MKKGAKIAVDPDDREICQIAPNVVMARVARRSSSPEESCYWPQHGIWLLARLAWLLAWLAWLARLAWGDWLASSHNVLWVLIVL